MSRSPGAPWCRLAAAGALLCTLVPGAARAGAPEQPGDDAGQPYPRRATPAAILSDEDREVIENLDLLQSMDAAENLELLLELEKGAE